MIHRSFLLGQAVRGQSQIESGQHAAWSQNDGTFWIGTWAGASRFDLKTFHRDALNMGGMGLDQLAVELARFADRV